MTPPIRTVRREISISQNSDMQRMIRVSRLSTIAWAMTEQTGFPCGMRHILEVLSIFLSFIPPYRRWMGLDIRESGSFLTEVTSVKRTSMKDRMGYDFIIMMKGKKALVSDLVMEVKGIFEEDRRCSIRDYKVSGTTVKRQLYPSDEKERYFHIYYNESKRITEREHLEAKIDQLGELLQEKQGTIGYECPRAICEYFDPVYHTKGDAKTFVSARERTDVINREIALCGYFVIITSEKMTAEEALEEYKSRDVSEKLFRGDKSYLGNRSYRVHSTESVENKIFIEFVALIIRNKIYTSLKDQMRMNKKKDNYITVPAAIKELEKIEMIRLSDGNYRLEHAVTSTQKEILKAFNLTGRNVQEQAIGINEELRMIRERK